MKNLKAMLTVFMCVVGLFGCATPNTRVSVYRYNLYDPIGTFTRTARLELVESPQGANVRIIGGASMSQCVAVPLRATVSRDATFTSIVTDPAFGNCDSVKYEIRNDGSGGSRYALVDGKWSKDQYDRGLTPNN